MERAYSDGVIKNLFLNAALKVRMVENPVCPAISVMLKDDCFSSLAASSRRYFTKAYGKILTEQVRRIVIAVAHMPGQVMQRYIFPIMGLDIQHHFAHRIKIRAFFDGRHSSLNRLRRQRVQRRFLGKEIGIFF